MTEAENYSDVTSGESLLALLDEIILLVENAKSVPLSASVLINRQEMLQLLRNAIEILPAEIVEAHHVIQEKVKVSDAAKNTAERIISQAEQQAAQIIAQANTQAQHLVSRDAVVVKARQQAAQIVDEAKSKALRIKIGANQYSDDLLANTAAQLSGVEEYLQQMKVQIEAGREVLSQRLEAEEKQRGEKTFGHAPQTAEQAVQGDPSLSAASSGRKGGGRHAHWAAKETKAAEHESHLPPVTAENEFVDSEVDFNTVQNEYARIEAESAHDSAAENYATAASGGEIPSQLVVDNLGMEESETMPTAATAPNVAGQAQYEELPAQLPADFDEFVPELDFAAEPELEQIKPNSSDPR